MTDNEKITDIEIIKALEYIDDNVNWRLFECPVKWATSVSVIAFHTRHLINRLQAQNEVYETCNARKDETVKSLESRLKKLQMQFDDISKLYSEIKAEAYKEFAERFKTLLETELHWCECTDEIIKPLNNLLKELVGEDK